MIKLKKSKSLWRLIVIISINLLIYQNVKRIKFICEQNHIFYIIIIIEVVIFALFVNVKPPLLEGINIIGV